MTDRTRRSFCFVLPWSFEVNGGVNEVVNNLMRQFATRSELGFQPLALELCWNPDQLVDSPGDIPKIWIRPHSPYNAAKPLHGIVGFLLLLPARLSELSRIAKRHNIAVFNLHFPDLEALTFVLLRMSGLFRGEVVLSIHGSDIRSAYHLGTGRRLAWKFLLRHASSVVACSDGLREEVLLVEPRCRAVTIHNGIDADRFAAETDATVNWPVELEGCRVIINVASFEFRKGHDILVRAFEQVAQHLPDVRLLLVGKPGPMSATVRKLVVERQLEKRVQILENIPHSQIYKLLTRSTLFVLATRWRKGEMGEGFAIAVLEAAAAKLPVVATASCGIEEIILSGETGITVPLEDSEALGRAMCEMLENPEAARQMAARLHAAVRERFTWQQAADAYARLASNL
jgi:glycosyltransferase involved in cell wall biosynthesis